MRSAEIISVSTDALSILKDASGTTPSPDTLRGLANSTHIFAPALATRSGAVSLVGIYSPGVGNTLGGCTSHWYSFIRPVLATRSGAAPLVSIYSPGVGNTLGGCASHWHLFARCCSGAAPRIGILLFARHWQYARGLHLCC
jgi:hypothetical protein